MEEIVVNINFIEVIDVINQCLEYQDHCFIRRSSWNPSLYMKFSNRGEFGIFLKTVVFDGQTEFDINGWTNNISINDASANDWCIYIVK